MSDCLIDLRRGRQNASRLVELLRFCPDLAACPFDEPTFSLGVTRADDPKLWGPCHDTVLGVSVALVGRVAFDDEEWEQGFAMPHLEGGAACKILLQKYTQAGIAGLERLNGNFLVIISDSGESKLHIVTDRCGAVLLFKATDSSGFPAFSTHPDALAKLLGCEDDLDLASLGEFLSTGRISCPYTYYRRIQAIEPGSSITVDLADDAKVVSRKYSSLSFRVDHSASEWQIAERLADSFRRSIHRRTNPRLGQTAVSLSGGLDSRMVLCAARPDARLKAFTFFDSENLEYRIAARIAQARGVELIPMRRDSEHYGNSAVLGTRILGGMGSFASNHFLGFRSQLKPFDNILTGCYCDYLFKALALNRKTSLLLRQDKPAKVADAYYRPVFQLESPVLPQIRSRLDSITGSSRNGQMSEDDLLTLESRRVFPLLYEPDSAQRGIPQRVMGWYLPVVDNDILDVYLTIPPRMKFNSSVYSKAVTLVCGEAVSRIPDANTGLAVNAPRLAIAASAYGRAFQNRYHRHIRPKLATQGSWPNWDYYLRHSLVIHSLWAEPAPEARQLLVELSGRDPGDRGIHAFPPSENELFIRMLTLKLWFQARRN